MNQPPEELTEFQPFLGNWKGKGWVEYQGQRFNFEQEETIQLKLQNSVLLVEGLGKVKDKITHQSLAVLSRISGNSFRFQTYEASGRTTNAEALFENGVWTWGFQDPQKGVSIRFRIRLNDRDQWFEEGERSPDGKNWEKFFEMILERAQLQ